MSELYEVLAGSCTSFVCLLSVNRSEPLKLQYWTWTEGNSCQRVATWFSCTPLLSISNWTNHITSIVNSYQNEALESVSSDQGTPKLCPQCFNAHIGKRYLPWVQGQCVLIHTDGPQSGVSQCPEGLEQVLDLIPFETLLLYQCGQPRSPMNDKIAFD